VYVHPKTRGHKTQDSLSQMKNEDFDETEVASTMRGDEIRIFSD